jgi:hypothetical protein
MEWYGKPYYSLDAWFKNEYGGKCRKIALDGGFTCPNRDGTLDTRGCIFCSVGGSGDFAVKPEELHKEIARSEGEYVGYVAYFQAFTNTYAPVERLRELYTAALSEEKVIGISIATRPDCLGEEVIGLLAELKTKFPEQFIWVELGLQTIHESTARYIRRHYALEAFDAACDRLREIGIPCIVHVILGLPGETREMMYQTVSYVNGKKPFGVKLQLLHVLERTELAGDYAAGRFRTLTMEEYVDIVIGCLERLDERIVIHRLTGDGDKNSLLAPEWSAHKMTVLNCLHHEMKVRKAVQGAALPK